MLRMQTQSKPKLSKYIKANKTNIKTQNQKKSQG